MREELEDSAPYRDSHFIRAAVLLQWVGVLYARYSSSCIAESRLHYGSKVTEPRQTIIVAIVNRELLWYNNRIVALPYIGYNKCLVRYKPNGQLCSLYVIIRTWLHTRVV